MKNSRPLPALWVRSNGPVKGRVFFFLISAATRHPPPYVVLKGAPGARVLALGAERVRQYGNSVLVFDQVERRRRGACAEPDGKPAEECARARARRAARGAGP